jgi:hypothetical protein
MGKFAYVNGNPVLAEDPTGLISVAELRHNPDPGANTVVCDGSGWPIAQLEMQLKPILDKRISDCLLIHEYSHIDDLRKVGVLGRVCMDQPRDTRIAVPGDIHDESEKWAYQAELACLETKISRLIECDACRPYVEERVKGTAPKKSAAMNTGKLFKGWRRTRVVQRLLLPTKIPKCFGD